MRKPLTLALAAAATIAFTAPSFAACGVKHSASADTPTTSSGTQTPMPSKDKG